MEISFNEVMLAYGSSFFFLRRSIALCEAALCEAALCEAALCEAVYDGNILAVCNEIPRELC